MVHSYGGAGVEASSCNDFLAGSPTEEQSKSHGVHLCSHLSYKLPGFYNGGFTLMTLCSPCHTSKLHL